jgi:hypothetical protein
MFKRLILEDYATLCTVFAFIVAATIFIATVWRAIRMPKTQVERFAQLPFESESSTHDKRA